MTDVLLERLYNGDDRARRWRWALRQEWSQVPSRVAYVGHKQCGWCGRRIRTTEVACAHHVDVEALWRQHCSP